MPSSSLKNTEPEAAARFGRCMPGEVGGLTAGANSLPASRREQRDHSPPNGVQVAPASSQKARTSRPFPGSRFRSAERARHPRGAMETNVQCYLFRPAERSWTGIPSAPRTPSAEGLLPAPFGSSLRAADGLSIHRRTCGFPGVPPETLRGAPRARPGICPRVPVLGAVPQYGPSVGADTGVPLTRFRPRSGAGWSRREIAAGG